MFKNFYHHVTIKVSVIVVPIAAVSLLVVGFFVSGSAPSLSNVGFGSLNSGKGQYTPYPGKPSPPPGFLGYVPPAPAKVKCTSADFHLYATWPGAYNGNIAESVELKNTSTTYCYLTGAPPIEVNLAKGGTEPVALGMHASQRVDIQPGQGLFFVFGSPASCTNANNGINEVATGMSLGMPGGDISGSGLNLDVACGGLSLLVFAVPGKLMNPPSTYAYPSSRIPKPGASS